MVWRDAQGRRITGLTHIAGESEDTNGAVEIIGQPLDAQLSGSKGPVRFIKCDVEGAEFSVFIGASAMIECWRPFVFAELVPEHLERYQHTVGDVLGFFADRDYLAWDLKDGGKPQRLVTPADYTGHDVFFTPRAAKLN